VNGIVAVSRLVNNNDTVSVVIGVPSEHRSNHDIINTITERFKGEHVVTNKGADKSFTIENVHVTAQPLGTAVDFFYDDNFNLKQEDLEDSKMLIVDVGFGTTDFAEMEGYNVISEGINGKDLGMVDVLRVVNQYAVNEGITKLSLMEIDQEIRKFNNSNQKKLVLKNKKGNVADVTEIYQNTIKDFTDEVVQSIHTGGRAMDEYEWIVFTGGTSMAIGKELVSHPRLEGDDRLAIVDDPQTANARGFYKIGVSRFGQ
jgi:hypothetical protein